MVGKWNGNIHLRGNKSKRCKIPECQGRNGCIVPLISLDA